MTNEERARRFFDGLPPDASDGRCLRGEDGLVRPVQASLAAEFAAVRRETLEIAAAHIDVPYTTTGQEFAAALRALAADPQGSEE